MIKSYKWNITKSGPIRAVILISKEYRDMFPSPKGEGITKRSEPFKIKCNNKEYSVYLEQVYDSNFRLWGIKGDLKNFYKDLNLLSDTFYKKGGSLNITHENNNYLVTYDKSGEETVYFEQEDIEESEKPDVTNLKEKEKTKALYDYYFKKEQIQFITFHPSYSYEEFVEGIRPRIDGINHGFYNHQGIFKEICLKAINRLIDYLSKDNTNIVPLKNWSDFDENLHQELKKVLQGLKIPAELNYVLIIDEINRGDISKIFGELITLIEKDKRLGEDNELVVKLPYTGDSFCIPPNLFIVGTMNTADRSLALVDIALRRRFDFEEMKPEISKLKNTPSDYGCAPQVKDSESFKKCMEAILRLNKKLGENQDIGKDKKIGHAFFCNIQSESEQEIKEHIISVWKSKILPLLEEYYFFDRSELENISNKNYTISDGWKIEKSSDVWGIVEYFTNLD